jgi:hypothetical protein
MGRPSFPGRRRLFLFHRCFETSLGLTNAPFPADKLPMHFRRLPTTLGLAAVIASLAVTGCKLTSKIPASEHPNSISLFDGRSLQGWAGLQDHWTVEDGSITGYTTKDNPLKQNTFLVYTNGPVANFELRLRYRIFHGNSGIQYRSAVLDPKLMIVGGYQADFEAGKTYSGILYEERGRGILANRGQRTHITEVDGKTKVIVLDQVAPSESLQANIHDEDWNDYLVIADGNHLMHFINGKLTADVIDDQASKAAKSGILALQIHVGPPMKVQFRDLWLKPMP